MFISSTQQSGHLIKICCLNERRTVLSSVSCSVVSDCLCPHGLKPTRFLWPWNSPGKNIGMGCRFLLQGNFPTQGSNLGLLGLLPALQADSLLSELEGSPSACICSVRGWHGKGLKEVSSLGTWLVLAGLAIKQWFLSLWEGSLKRGLRKRGLHCYSYLSSLVRQTHCSLFMPPGPDCACGLRREEGTCVFESARQPRALEPDRCAHWVTWKHCVLLGFMSLRESQFGLP